MQCPSCGNKQTSNIECERCGIIFKKYTIRQKRLADEKTAREEQSVQKKNSATGIIVALIIGLTVGGGAFFYFGNNSSSVPDTAITTPQAKVPSREVTKKSSVRPTSSRPSSSRNREDNSLEGLALQLNESNPANTAIEKARNATVFIKTSWGSGSGFFISDNGLIITNKHVLQMQEKELNTLNANADKFAKLLGREDINLRYLRKQVPQVRDKEMQLQLQEEIREREREYAKYKGLHKELLNKISDIETASPTDDVEIILIDGSSWAVESVTLSDQHDLALLSISAYGSPYLAISRTARDQGQKVYTVGNPHGLRHTVTSGIISGYRTFNGVSLLQTDAPINPGNSGGPLVDEAGRALGVNTMIIRDTEGIGFAIPMKSVFEEFGNYLPEY